MRISDLVKKLKVLKKVTKMNQVDSRNRAFLFQNDTIIVFSMAASKNKYNAQVALASCNA